MRAGRSRVPTGLIARLQARRSWEARSDVRGFTDQGLVFANPDGSRCHPETMSRSCKESQAACLPA